MDFQEWVVSIKTAEGRRELLVKAENIHEAIFNVDFKMRGTDFEITAINQAT